MKDLVLYIHGKGGNAAESEHYRALFPGDDVLGLDYRTITPWETGAEIRREVLNHKAKYKSITLIANSIGAYFCMNTGIDALVRRAYFISPIVDMEKLIRNMMHWANVTEEELRENGVIVTFFGEELSWEYLCYVREHPVAWFVPTEILYGSADDLTDRETIENFVRGHRAHLTVMENGEHWFHTTEQMYALDEWICNGKQSGFGKNTLWTSRLRIYPATQHQMETVIAAESDDELKSAYSQMLNESRLHPEQREWFGMWIIELKDGTPVGDLCFKGISDGATEIGYGILQEHQNGGYATEAVKAAAQWAFQHPEVVRIEAETESGNMASQKVLEKCGFVSTGMVGREGPRFILTREEFA